jgi:hypothetical protein
MTDSAADKEPTSRRAKQAEREAWKKLEPAVRQEWAGFPIFREPKAPEGEPPLLSVRWYIPDAL